LPRSKMGIRSARMDTLHTLSPEETQLLRTAAQNGGLKSLLGERRLNKVVDRIESQPACSVGELALEVQLSPAHLQRLFKQKTGIEVRQDIIPWTGILPGVTTGKYDAAVTAVLVDGI